MKEIQAKEELIDMKAKLEQGEKICRKTYRVRLGIEMARLGEPAIKKKKKKTLEDSSLVCLGVDVRLGVALLRQGVGQPLANEDTCFRLGEECRVGIRIFPFLAQS